MELFKVERYKGDAISFENSTKNESKNLARLLEQARGRKRSRECANSKQTNNIKTDKADEEKSLLMRSSENARKKKNKKKKEKLRRKLAEQESLNEKSLKNIDAVQEEIQSLSVDTSSNENSKEGTSILNEDIEYFSNPEVDRTSEQILNKDETQVEMTVIGGEHKKKKKSDIQRALPKWLSNPCFFSSDVSEAGIAVTEIGGLHSNLVMKLQKQGVDHFFPVQEAVVPAVLTSWERNSPFGKGGYMPRDICVCAPTGSGKTLAYVLPVIELLRQSAVRRLEALVIVPTKDLATQVWNVFNVYVQGNDLNVGLANGLKSLQKEQQQLGSISFVGYSSNVNILVATPGRLVEHISSTHGFSLKFLRFLIIDEADRLLAEPYFGWLDKVYASAFPSAEKREECRTLLSTLTPMKAEKLQRPLQKLLFSATFTQNPEKLALLRLHMPRFFTVPKSENGVNSIGDFSKETGENYDILLRTPSTLQESMYICNSGGKPLVLLYLLTTQGFDGVLCFTSSIDSTHRLYLLVQHFGGIGVQEFSSNLSAARRQTILNDFKTGKTQIIICSDAMARGLDVPCVKYVISYDPPVSSKTYVHRVGRTARAGKTGSAITLLHDNEVFHFKKMMKSLKKGKISKRSVKDGDLEVLMKRYESALEQLKTCVTSVKKKTKRMRR